MKKALLAKPHPRHYLLHKYWGRKPHNIVSEYIRNYTRESDTVLDPFMGSGVTIIESLKLNRKAIGIDLNPLSYFITKVTLENINLEEFLKTFNNILLSCEDVQRTLYQTHCIKCEGQALINNTIWDNNIPKKIRGVCRNCGTFLKNPEAEDRSKIKYIENNFNILCGKNKIGRLPQEKIIKYVRRSGAIRITDLFTKRNIIAIGVLRSKICMIKDTQSRSLLNLTFSSMLPNVSSMIPGNVDTGNGRSGWVISKLYIPKIHTEKNVFLAFKQRLSTIYEGKKELCLNDYPRLARIFNRSSENIKDIVRNNSIDYIFTDPPYGENIPYFGCSMVFNSWLGFKTDYENEIICDSYRKKGLQDYKKRLTKVMKECHRVLKPNKLMTLTFNNRDFRVWKAIIDSICESKFKLIDIKHHLSAVSSGTQGLNKESAIKGDFFYTFKKINNNFCTNRLRCFSNGRDEIESYLINQIKGIVKRKNGATISEIYESLIPTLINNNMLGKCAEFLNNIDNILNIHFRLLCEKDARNNKESTICKWHANGSHP